MKRSFAAEDRHGVIHRVRPKNIESFSGMIAGGTCRLYKLLMCSIDGKNSMNLCLKKTKAEIIENMLPERTVEHQMEVFRQCVDGKIPTYTDMRIRHNGQVLVTPFIGNEKNHLCFSANNNSKAKSVIIDDMNGITRRDISNLSEFGVNIRDTLQKLRDAHIKVGDDAYFFDYNTDGGILQFFIGDFHDITLSDETMEGENYRHNHNSLEFAFQQLHDDGIIDQALYDQFYADIGFTGLLR